MARPELPDTPLAADERRMLQAFLDLSPRHCGHALLICEAIDSDSGS